MVKPEMQLHLLKNFGGHFNNTTFDICSSSPVLWTRRRYIH